MAARSGGITAGQLLGLLTLGVCVAAIFDPRLRRLCFGLICKL